MQPQARREWSLWFQLPEGKQRLKSLKSIQQVKTQLCGPTIFSVRVEGWQLWLGLCDDFLLVHALLQSLKHALLSDSLNVPSDYSKAKEHLSPALDLKQDDFTHKPVQIRQVQATLEDFISAWTIEMVKEVCTFSFFSHPTPASCGVSNTHHLPAAEGRKWQMFGA